MDGRTGRGSWWFRSSRGNAPWVLLLCAVAGGLLAYPLDALSRSWGPPLVIVPYALLAGVLVALLAWRGDRAFAARLQDDLS